MFAFGTDAGNAEKLFQFVQMFIALGFDVLNKLHCQGAPKPSDCSARASKFRGAVGMRMTAVPSNKTRDSTEPYAISASFLRPAFLETFQVRTVDSLAGPM